MMEKAETRGMAGAVIFYDVDLLRRNKVMEIENERRRRELYDTLGIRDDDSLFDENSLSDKPSNGANGTPSHGYEESPVKESQSGSDGQRSNIHEDKIPSMWRKIQKLGCIFQPRMIWLRNMLWIHLRGRAAYEEFHYVICFDTTYLVNRYRMPFATFVGVNHHGQSILLGCALLSHEDAETFNKVLEKFKGVEDFTKPTNEFKALIFDSLTIEMFETNWNDFLTNYGLENNEWLMKLYSERENWMPVYLKHMFWVGMMSTQRSEGMHAYFDGYVEQYEMAIRGKNEKELLSEFVSKK
ncbi:hypothetical protein GH714_018164 [Hevea brasiliensis]|uniref:Protein FAR1-RELATED SEQUENCE n=1 Tax=Hevea brasiliensis TaxID=3981 RepID=A0A6A6L9J8_HEVBR|nr:hypothetical protein GH714_018164 [Hevea brasiliensis]